MIPTFLGISLIVFAVLNFAPGKPGAGKQTSDLASDMRAEGSQESYRIFREQFNLDKPVLFNTLPSLQKQDVLDALRVVAGIEDSSAAARVQAQDELEAYGFYSIPHLIAILRESDEDGVDRLRDVTAYILRINARRKLIDPYAENPSAELRAANKLINAENAKIRERNFGLDDPEDKKQEITENWIAWYEEHRERWQWSSAQKLNIFFFDTRFATYWSNLAHLDFGVSLATKEPVLGTLL